MTLKQKREIVIDFKSGVSMTNIYYRTPLPIERDEIEQVIRDFMNGKFSLKPKRRKSK